MINKFKEDGLTWYIDEEKGVFICKCEDAREQLRKEYNELINEYNGDWESDIFLKAKTRWFKKNGDQLNSFFGKAKANIDAGEIVDIERGKSLAKARLIEKLAAHRANFYMTILDEAKNFEAVLKKRIDGNARICSNSAIRISELSGVSEEN